MAILQEADAVFYHPLDDPTESLEAQAWTGSGESGSGAFVAAKVSRGLTGVGDEFAPFGAEAEFLSADGTDDISVAALSLTKFVVCYRDNDNFGRGKAKVGTVSGTSVTFGAETEFHGGFAAAYISAAALSATTFVVAYRDMSDSDHGKARVGTVDGTSVTNFGTVSEFGAGQTTHISVAALSATKFVVAYEDGADSNHGTSKIGTVAGTAMTFGAEAEFNSAGTTVYISAATLSATTFVVAYQDNGSGHGKSRVGTVSGTDITFGAEAAFLAAIQANNIKLCAISSTTFVVAYTDSSDGNRGKAKLGTVAGSDITYGAEAEFVLNTQAVTASVIPVSAAKFVVSYRDLTADSGRAKVGTIDATDITFGAQGEFAGDASSGMAIAAAPLDANTFVTAYTDTADSDHGAAKVGTILAVPALLIGSPDIAPYGPTHEFNNQTSTDVSIASLSATKFVVTRRDTVFNPNQALVGTVSGADITYGAGATYSLGASHSSSVAALSATKFVVAYADQADSNNGKARVGTVSGTDVTFGAEVKFNNGSTGETSTVALDSTKFVVAYRNNSFVRGAAHVGTVSGTDITFGAFKWFLDTAAATDISVIKLSATEIVVTYRNNGDSSGNSRVGTVSGTDITYGAEAEFIASGGGGFAAALDSTKFVVVYGDAPSDKVRVGTVSGTDITFAAATIIGLTGNIQGVIALSAIEFVIIDDGFTRSGRVVGTIATIGTGSESFVGSASSVAATALDATTFVVAYRDLGDSSHPKANVGTVISAYPSAVGAARLAFSAWTKSST